MCHFISKWQDRKTGGIMWCISLTVSIDKQLVVDVVVVLVIIRMKFFFFFCWSFSTDYKRNDDETKKKKNSFFSFLFFSFPLLFVGNKESYEIKTSYLFYNFIASSIENTKYHGTLEVAWMFASTKVLVFFLFSCCSISINC